MGDPRLGRDIVVRAAVGIADAEGFDRITMRRVSQALGVTPMALYRYLPDKAALVDVVIDESLRAVPCVDPDGDVLGEFRRCFGGLHRLLIDHPGLAKAASERPLEGPVAIEIGERVLSLLQRCGVGERDAANALVAAFSLTLGSALYWVSRQARGQSERAPGGAASESTAVRVRSHAGFGGEGSAVFHDAMTKLVSGYLTAGEAVIR